VRRRPRVAFFSVGDARTTPGRPLAPGEAYDSARHALWGALASMGVEAIDLGGVGAEPEAIAAALREAAGCDAILCCGGAAGDAAALRLAATPEGELAYWTLEIRPGRPFAFGRIGQAWLFGLPESPVAMMVSVYQLVADALLALRGVDPLPPRPSFQVRCLAPIAKEPGRRAFLRGRLQRDAEGWSVEPAAQQGAAVLRSMSGADCFVVLPEDRGDVAAGEPVEVQVFEGAT
jgi:molybdopterin molybdotransferase